MADDMVQDFKPMEDTLCNSPDPATRKWAQGFAEDAKEITELVEYFLGPRPNKRAKTSRSTQTPF
jgi:hypothetical protein